ncbi:ankyrin repeat and SOCS box protein 13 isoform X2 [Dunckerocampus dactyliophorus]|uniref:ankyrin repeat and SOCS box protein 13 isoform X2 n=1 Tax=Dunckerocampus dactyliophorus TaxID=161453 RepID=UPI0024055072|nr:ankyrin repeat and SOCS box protein 13 isoform X2 [Dunckerocampus dactyliophorus]
MRSLGHLVRMPPRRLPGEVFRARVTGRRPRGRPRTRRRGYVSQLARERLVTCGEELDEVSREREVWASLFRLLSLQPDLGVSEEDGGVDGRFFGASIGGEIQKWCTKKKSRAITGLSSASPLTRAHGLGFWTDRTAVHEAAAQGRAVQLQQLIESGAAVNMVAIDSITPLHEACIQGHTQCVRLLLGAGAQVDARNIDGSTPLCDACAAGSLECVKVLLEYGATVNPPLFTFSPLHEACMGGANVNAAKLHETALHHAAKARNVHLIELLVEFGANLYARDNLNKKPIQYAGLGSPSYLCCQFYEDTPLSLQQISRVALRRMLGVRALDVFSKLGLPSRIVGFLSYMPPPIFEI